MLDRRSIPTSVKRLVYNRAERREGGHRLIPCEVCDINAGPVREYHHIVPFEHGGPHSAQNLILLCPTCHALVTRDRGLWAKASLYGKEIGERIALLADIQHEPASLARAAHEEGWRWLAELTGFTPSDVPEDAFWGQRWRQGAKLAEQSKTWDSKRGRV